MLRMNNKEMAETSQALFPDAYENTTNDKDKFYDKYVWPTCSKKHRAIEAACDSWDKRLKSSGTSIKNLLQGRIFSANHSKGLIKFDTIREEEIEEKEKFFSLCMLAQWKLSKNIFQFDNSLFDVIKKSINTKYNFPPSTCLDHFPYWSTYIDLPGSPFLIPNLGRVNTLRGLLITSSSSFISKSTLIANSVFFISKFYEDKEVGTRVITFIISKDNKGFVTYSLDDNLNFVNCEDIEDDNVGVLSLNLLLYINTYLQTIYNENNNSLPENPKPKRKSGKLRWQEAAKNTVWKVGTEVGERIREYNRTHASGSHTSKSPHIRRAHWHTYLTGPRTNPVPILKWIPPIPIAMPREELSVNEN